MWLKMHEYSHQSSKHNSQCGTFGIQEELGLKDSVMTMEVFELLESMSAPQERYQRGYIHLECTE